MVNAVQYARNKQYYDDYRKKAYARNREILKQLKINGCAICGYSKCHSALDFHHVNNDREFVIDVATMNLTDDRVVKEIQKCILLCSNCHREIHTKERENNE